MAAWFNGVSVLTESKAKFSGYQYGGRPLGLSFVKYTNVSGGESEAPAGNMEM